MKRFLMVALAALLSGCTCAPVDLFEEPPRRGSPGEFRVSSSELIDETPCWGDTSTGTPASVGEIIVGNITGILTAAGTANADAETLWDNSHCGYGDHALDRAGGTPFSLRRGHFLCIDADANNTAYCEGMVHVTVYSEDSCTGKVLVPTTLVDFFSVRSDLPWPSDLMWSFPHGGNNGYGTHLGFVTAPPTGSVWGYKIDLTSYVQRPAVGPPTASDTIMASGCITVVGT